MRTDVDDERERLLRVLHRWVAVCERRRALQVVRLAVEVFVSLSTLSLRNIKSCKHDAVGARAVEITTLHTMRLRHIAQLFELAMQHGRGVFRACSEERVDLGPSLKGELLAAACIVDIPLSKFPELPPDHKDFERRSQFRINALAKNEANFGLT
jgi:hypothetical protein